MSRSSLYFWDTGTDSDTGRSSSREDSERLRGERGVGAKAKMEGMVASSGLGKSEASEGVSVTLRMSCKEFVGGWLLSSDSRGRTSRKASFPFI